MKHLDLSAVTDAAQLRLKAGTLQFLQDANKEIFSAIVKSVIGSEYSDSIVYVLFGCNTTISGSTISIHSGAVFFNGEVYLIEDGFSYTDGQNPMFKIVVDNDTLDPVVFSDTTIHNIHNVRKMGFVIDGSGITDFANRVKHFVETGYNPDKLTTKVFEIGAWNMDSTNKKVVTLGIEQDKIRSISVMIWNDAGSLFFPIDYYYTLPSGYYSYGSSGNPLINLFRADAGIFNSPEYSSVAVNRGYITVQYIA